MITKEYMLKRGRYIRNKLKITEGFSLSDVRKLFGDLIGKFFGFLFSGIDPSKFGDPVFYKGCLFHTNAYGSDSSEEMKDRMDDFCNVFFCSLFVGFD